MAIKTLFNPLIKDNNSALVRQSPNGWLERIYTEPNVAMLPHDQAMDFINLFCFENLSDASQIGYINDGVGKFIGGSDNLCAKSFKFVAGDLVDMGKPYEMYAISPQGKIDSLEMIMRALCEGDDQYNVDTSYCYPSGMSYVSDDIERVGWLESRLGAFVLKDKAIYHSMCDGLGLIPNF